MQLFSLVGTFLIGGFGIIYLLSLTEQTWLVSLLVASAWCALFVWLFLKTREPDHR